MSKEIGFHMIPLKQKIEEVRKGLSDDPLLHDAIVWHSNQLIEDNIETWETDRNMIVTEVGYKIAMYEKEEVSLTGQYMDLCERVVSHLVTLIRVRKLEYHFSDDVLEKAEVIKSIHIKRKEEENA